MYSYTTYSNTDKFKDKQALAVEVAIKKRKKDYMDICNAPINTEYFMITNSYNVVAQQVQLFFTNDDSD